MAKFHREPSDAASYVKDDQRASERLHPIFEAASDGPQPVGVLTRELEIFAATKRLSLEWGLAASQATNGRQYARRISVYGRTATLSLVNGPMLSVDLDTGAVTRKGRVVGDVRKLTGEQLVAALKVA